MPQLYLKMDSSDILWCSNVIVTYAGAVSPTHCVLRGIMVKTSLSPWSIAAFLLVENPFETTN